jgi:O-antigen/teichoic acid export membrane protein
MATIRGVGAVAVLAWVSPTLRAFFAWQGLISALSLVLMALATYSSLPGAGGRWSTKAMRSVWRFAGGMIGITFLTLLLTQVDKILLSRLLTLHDYGHYALAATVAGGLYMLVSPIAQAWYPRLSALHAAGDRAALARVYHQGAQLVTVILGSVAVVLVVFAEPILNLWIRDPALADRTAPLLALLALGNLLNGLMWIPYQTQLAFGWTALMIRINIAAVLVIVPAILWVTPHYGSEGAAAAWVALNAGYLVIGVQFMYRRVLSDEKRRWYVEDILRPLSAASIVALVLRWVLPIPESAAWQAIGMLLAFGLVFLAAALAAPLLYRATTSALARMLRGRNPVGELP